MVFDSIVLVVLLISALHAFWRGFIREILTIFGAIGGVLAAITFGESVRPLMNGMMGIKEGEAVAKLFDLIPMTLVSSVISYALIFIVVFGVLSFISHLIAEQVRALGLGAVDRTLGVVFGLVRGLLILGIFYLPVHIMMDKDTKEAWFKDAHTHVYIQAIADTIVKNLPDTLIPLKEDKEGDKNTKGARDALKDMGVLEGEAHGTSTTDGAAANREGPAPSEAGQGYNDAERKMLDTIIEKSIDAGVDQLQNR